METGSFSTPWYWPRPTALASCCCYFCGQSKILINNEQGSESWSSIAFLWKSPGSWSHFVMIFLSGKPKKETKIILEFSMMKMDRTLPAFLTKCFTITSYYFSCNSLQVFLMKEQFIFCKDSMQILGVVFHSLKKARSPLKKARSPPLLVWVLVPTPPGSSMGSVPAKTSLATS